MGCNTSKESIQQAVEEAKEDVKETAKDIARDFIKDETKEETKNGGTYTHTCRSFFPSLSLSSARVWHSLFVGLVLTSFFLSAVRFANNTLEVCALNVPISRRFCSSCKVCFH